jgi:hypothetical protein
VGHCHHVMARPRAGDGGHNLQVWKVAGNLLKEQFRMADKGWSFGLRIGQGANNVSS